MVFLKLNNLKLNKSYRLGMCHAFSSDSTLYEENFMKPEEPNDADCCHSGCQSCVFEVYAKSLEKWKNFNYSRKLNFRFDLLSQTKFKQFQLIGIKKITDNTNMYTFQPFVDDLSLSGCLPYHAGQYLSMRLPTNQLPGSKDQKCSSNELSESTHVVRDFTITSLPGKIPDCRFETIIKLYEGSFTSNYIRSLKIKDITHWRGPYGDFKHIPNLYSNLIMFCMGTGIAPMYPIACEIVEDEHDETVVSLHFGCHSSKDIILRKEINKLSAFWNFNCTYYLPKEKDLSGKMYTENFVIDRIKEEHILAAISGKRNYYILVCGSTNFNNDISKIFQKLNIDKSSYFLF